MLLGRLGKGVDRHLVAVRVCLRAPYARHRCTAKLETHLLPSGNSPPPDTSHL